MIQGIQSEDEFAFIFHEDVPAGHELHPSFEEFKNEPGLQMMFVSSELEIPNKIKNKKKYKNFFDNMILYFP
jgi:hypothetical protein